MGIRSLSIYFILAIILSIASSPKLYAQDKVIRKDNTVVEGKILKVDENSIEIDPTGEKPFLIIKRVEAKMIIYEDNTVVDFETLNDKDIKNTISNPSDVIIEDATAQANTSIDIYTNTNPYTKDDYLISEILSLKDPRNNQEFYIYLKGSFSITGDKDHGIQVRNLKLNIELRKDGKRSSEVIEFNRLYTVDYRAKLQELDRVESLNLDNNYIDFKIVGSWLLEGKENTYLRKNEIMGRLDLVIDWSNF